MVESKRSRVLSTASLYTAPADGCSLGRRCTVLLGAKLEDELDDPWRPPAKPPSPLLLPPRKIGAELGRMRAGGVVLGTAPGGGHRP
eukprot:CAMPEP_0178407344 /NCGR_PEP_ID=MMETSP0689_2-20121128/19382_1 /TAXON_ID=160604 /ORGANISM="Amphidinium massartii, Strain CS-259" /LENGTH=86 /DNA_ID=CAMNT_0020028419 /DNA_START=376 /DNA_END=636 /DNA_ORIENTATION=+